MDYCKVCHKPSMVMARDYSQKVPYKKAKDATEFVCGPCITRGALRSRVKVAAPDAAAATFDLKAWRKQMKMTQKALAMHLMVSRVQVSKVESGERIIPQRWVDILEKMYPTHA